MFTEGQNQHYEELMQELPGNHKKRRSGKQSSKYQYRYADLDCELCIHHGQCDHVVCPYILTHFDEIKDDPNFADAIADAESCENGHKFTLFVLQDLILNLCADKGKFNKTGGKTNMNELKLIKSDHFGAVQCDIYQRGEEFYMTREQVGRALEYVNPQKGVTNVHERNKDRIDQFSTSLKMRVVEGGREINRNVIAYTRKGVMEICRHSKQPKANAFMDWVWDIMDGLISGKTALVPMTEYQQMLAETRQENLKIRRARTFLQLAKPYRGTAYEQMLYSYASRELTNELIIPMPHAK